MPPWALVAGGRWSELRTASTPRLSDRAIDIETRRTLPTSNKPILIAPARDSQPGHFGDRLPHPAPDCLPFRPFAVEMASQADFRDRQFLAVIGDEVRASPWQASLRGTSLGMCTNGCANDQDSITGLLLAGIGVCSCSAPIFWTAQD